jgi:hypothetical protein
MKIKTSELIGPALDWAVAKCEGFYGHTDYRPTTNWSLAGPIIEREKICVSWAYPRFTGDIYPVAQYFQAPHSALEHHRQKGPTPLVAAMRCFVASKLGDEVKIPDELCYRKIAG